MKTLRSILSETFSLQPSLFPIGTGIQFFRNETGCKFPCCEKEHDGTENQPSVSEDHPVLFEI